MTDRKAYQDRIEAQLKEWKAELEGLHARALKADADARIAMSDRVTELTRLYGKAQDAFLGLVSTGEEKWGDAREKLETTRDDFKRAWQAAKQEFAKSPSASLR